MESQMCTMKKLWQNGKGLGYVTVWHVLVTFIGHALHCCNGAFTWSSWPSTEFCSNSSFTPPG